MVAATRERKSRAPTAFAPESPAPARGARDEMDRTCRRRRRCSFATRSDLLLLANHRRELPNEIAHSVACDRGDLVIFVTVIFCVRAELFSVAFDRRVELRSADQTRLLRERLRMQLQLARHHLGILLRMFVRREIDEVQQRGTAL